MMNRPKVGDTYYYVPYDKRQRSYDVVVERVGSKYFYTSDGHKFSLLSGVEYCGDYSPRGALFESRAFYEHSLYVKRCDNELRSLLDYLTDDDTLVVYELVKSKISGYGR